VIWAKMENSFKMIWKKIRTFHELEI